MPPKVDNVFVWVYCHRTPKNCKGIVILDIFEIISKVPKIKLECQANSKYVGS